MKKIGLFIVIVLICTLAFALVGCNVFEKKAEEDTTSETQFAVQYADSTGVHTLDVTLGKVFSIPSIPTREGYTFVGLYDQKENGTQYIDEMGVSISPYSDKRDLVLFARFVPNHYTVALDYQGATVTGDRQYTVAYDTHLPPLPTDLTIEHNTFVGWFTEPNCSGKQIADPYGNLPIVSTINSENFDISKTYFTLYAGFVSQKYSVTFWADSQSQETQVEYGTPINTIVPDFRRDGKAVISWSKKQNDESLSEVFMGKVTSDLVLYAAEWAPVLSFVTNSDNELMSYVAKAGSVITLPTPTKALSQFVRWEDLFGNAFDAITMPDQSTTLVAVWQPKIEFDANGGNAIAGISAAAGSALVLPTPQRDGYIFADWYTADKQVYTATTMPTEGVLLRAGWYKSESVDIIKTPATSSVHFGDLHTTGHTLKSDSFRDASIDLLLSEVVYKPYISYITLNIYEYLGLQSANITIDWHVNVKNDNGQQLDKLYFSYYSDKIVSDTTYMGGLELDLNDQWTTHTFTTTHQIDKVMYICVYSNSGEVYFSDWYYTIHYPNYSKLYL